MGGAHANDTDISIGFCSPNNWTGQVLDHAVQFMADTVQHVCPIFGILAVVAILIMPGSAGKVSRFFALVANDRPVWNTIAIQVLVSTPILELLELFFPNDLAPFDWLIGILKSLGYPGVHPKIQIRKYEDWSLVLLGNIK